MFEVYNEDGKIQFFADGMTFGYVSKGLVTTTSGVTYSAPSSFYIDLLKSGYDTPIIATRSIAPVAPLYSVDVGAYIRYWFNCAGAVGTKVAYYVMDLTSRLATPVPAGSAGLEIYNAAGQTVFSTRTPIPTLIGKSAGLGAVALTSGKKYAVWVPAFTGYRTQIVTNYGPEMQYESRSQVSKHYGGYVSVSPYQAGLDEVDFMSAASAAAAPDYSIPPEGAYIFDVSAFGDIAGEPAFYVNISPASQNKNQATDSYTFPNATLVLAGSGSISSYSWSIENALSGSFAIVSGQGTNTVSVQATGVSPDVHARATLRCAVVVNGETQYAYSQLDFHNIAANVSVSMSLTELYQSSTTASFAMGAVSLTAIPAASSYTWNISNVVGGSLSFTGQGQASVNVTASGVPLNGTVTGQLSCTAVVNGVSYARSASIQYDRVSYD